MRRLSLVLILAFILLFAILYTLLAPAYIGDYRWVLIAFPLALLVLREFIDYLPGYKSRSRYSLYLVPDQDPDDENAEDMSLDGLWIGTLQIWSDTADHPPEVIPLSLIFKGSGVSLSPYGIETPAPEARPVDAEILEYDPDRGQLDLALAVELPSGREIFQAQLTRQKNTFVPEDNTDPVTVEISRTRLVKSPA
jgi:hypothetical protein